MGSKVSTIKAIFERWSKTNSGILIQVYNISISIFVIAKQNQNYNKTETKQKSLSHAATWMIWKYADQKKMHKTMYTWKLIFVS